jgi:hypothetical protein
MNESSFMRASGPDGWQNVRSTGEREGAYQGRHTAVTSRSASIPEVDESKAKSSVRQESRSGIVAWIRRALARGLDRPARLVELERRYRAFGGPAVSNPVWSRDFVATIDLERFRADGPYVWQKPLPNLDEAALARTFEYARSGPHSPLLAVLDEDGAFGAHAIRISEKVVSRDLLDSVFELHFLSRRTELGRRGGFRVLDIGAGYGRLAHRATTLFPEVRWLSTDAVATSTFVAERYLAFRGLAERAPVIPLDAVEATLAAEPVDLAVNVHSFSECTPAAIDWWIGRLAISNVPRLFVVPNAVSPDGREPLTNRGEAMGPIFAAHGFELELAEPKYADPEVQRRGLSPSGYFLYRRATDAPTGG